MFIARWLPTVIAFPVGGLLAIQIVGSLEGPLTGAVGGLLTGAVIGAGQWFVLRSHGLRARWVALTAGGMAAGSALAAALAGTSTTIGALVVTGLVIGLVVGALQATQLRRGARVASAWTALVGVTWGVGWLISGNVIVDAERGYYIFGLSGALLVTLATGVTLSRILATRPTPLPGVVSARATAIR